MLQGASGGNGENTYRESRVANSRRAGTLQPRAVMAALQGQESNFLINRGGTTLYRVLWIFQRALFVFIKRRTTNPSKLHLFCRRESAYKIICRQKENFL